jgi:hypothetical protein
MNIRESRESLEIDSYRFLVDNDVNNGIINPPGLLQVTQIHGYPYDSHLRRSKMKTTNDSKQAKGLGDRVAVLEYVIPV